MMKFSFNIPTRGNEKLEKILNFVETDIELATLWRCSNVMAVDRQRLNDHGPIHVKIVANRALKILRMLVSQNITPNVVEDYKMDFHDAEIIIFLASVLHDLGLSVVRDRHEVYSVPLAMDILKRCLPLVYKEEQITIMLSEILHAVLTHHEPSFPFTLEAGVVKVADALDMEKGRARIPYENGSINIHSISAFAIEKVDILDGEEKPVIIQIRMDNPAGVFQVDNLLGAKIKGSGLEEYIQVEVFIGEREKPIILKFGE
jgi:metal-dependent HD superfamily phosphatase/phosphodiesterase